MLYKKFIKKPVSFVTNVHDSVLTIARQKGCQSPPSLLYVSFQTLLEKFGRFHWKVQMTLDYKTKLYTTETFKKCYKN